MKKTEVKKIIPIEVMDKIADNYDEQKEILNKLLDGGEKGHAEIFTENYKDKVKITTMSGSGFYFNSLESRLWEEKNGDFFISEISFELDRIINSILDSFRKYKGLKDDEQKKIDEKRLELIKLIKKVHNYKHCENVFKFSKPSLMDTEFRKKLNNSKTNLLPIRKNKVIDLKTLEIRDRTAEDYFNFEIDCEFNKSKLTNANKFFSDIMGNNIELINYLQTQLGYCMTGETNLRCLYIFWGVGSNGKSVLCKLLRKIMNSLCIAVSKKVFIKDKFEGSNSHTSHLIPLVGARLSVYSESEENEQLNIGLIKSLTGDDEISARELYGKQFSFTPVSKYIFLTNYKPTFNVDDLATIDRLIYIPFGVRFTDKPEKGEIKRDINFIDELLNKNLSEVFSWLCIGANKYYDYIKKGEKIEKPKIIKDAMTDYINEIDDVKTFIKDTIKQDEEGKINRTTLYEMYKNYYTDCGNGLLLKNTQFYKRIENVLNTKFKKLHGDRYLTGYKLIDDEEEPTTAISEVIAESPTNEPELTADVFEEVQAERPKKINNHKLKNGQIILPLR